MKGLALGFASVVFLTQFAATSNLTATAAGPRVPIGSPARTAAEPAVIDVMILYTTEQKALLGGEAALATQITLSVTYLNEAFRQSGVDARVRLVHTEEVVPAWHVDSHSAAGELDWVYHDPKVAVLRATYGADLVSLIAALNGNGGMAYCTTPYSVFDGSPESFAHEAGHNLGCAHELGNPDAGCGSASFNRGLAFTSPLDGKQYGTIMSYAGLRCDLFSNPTNLFLGAPTGIADAADNARQLNAAAPAVAAWQATVVPDLQSAAFDVQAQQFQFEIVGPNDGTCQVDFSPDDLHWTALGDYELNSGSVTVKDQAGTAPSRFYRVQYQSFYLPTEVGYLRKTLPKGHSMVANQFDHGDNSFAALFPTGTVADGTIAFKFDNHANPPRFAPNSYSSGDWANPAMRLNPGEGAIFRCSTPTTLTLVGKILPAVNCRVRSGLSICGAAVPISGSLSSELGFPGCPPQASGITPGDTIYKMSDPMGRYDTFTWNGMEWTPAEPVLEAGEAFWCRKSSQTGYWRRVFSAPP